MILNSFRLARALETITITQGRCYASTSRFKPSPEQAEVVKWLKTHNVVVSARPGAGKTATAEALAMENSQVPIAVITYSKRLQVDTHKRLKKYPKVDTYTFHGLAGHLFGRIIKDDIDLITERDSQSIPRIKKFPKYRFIVLDELQDLTDNLYWLASTFIASIARSTGKYPAILALGDSRQAIFDFQGADSRFLEKAETVFQPFSDRDWKSLSLSHSFRLTRPTADFINNAWLGGEQYILGTGDGPKPLYIRANLWETEAIFDKLWPHIKQYKPDKCAILAPSIRIKKHCHPLKLLENKLSSEDVPLSVSIFDDAPLDEDVIRGKLVFSTYHQFKGSERDLVIVFGADNSWYKWFGPDVPPNVCPNPVFVALTRARKQLIIIQSAKASPMPFIDIPKLKSHATFASLHENQAPSDKEPEPTVRVTDLTRHMRDEDLRNLVSQYIRIEKPALATTRELINPPTKVPTHPRMGLWEYVADLSGVAVTAAFELKNVEGVHENERNRATWFARQTAIYEAENSGYNFRYRQLKKQQWKPFSWLVGFLDRAVERITGEVTQEGKIAMEDLQYEQEFSSWLKHSIPNRVEPELTGRADIIFVPKDGSRATIWEIKLVQSLKLEHVAQIVQYGYLWAENHRDAPFPRLLLFNVLDGERWEICTTKEEASKFVMGILHAKRTRTRLTDDEFRRQYEKTADEAQSIVDKMPRPKKV